MDAHPQFTVSADVYDIIYGQVVDYDAHANQIRGLIDARVDRASSLLEMACGTGQFLSRFQDDFAVVGSDLSGDMLQRCTASYPSIELHQGDYATLDLGRQFDIVVCLFSSIGYVVTEDRLRVAVANIARHTTDGGVVVIDGWLRPEAAIDGFQSHQAFDEDGVLVMRSTLAFVKDGHTEMFVGHMVNDGHAIRYFTERHRMGLFSDEVYVDALERAGVRDVGVVDGFDERGRFVGIRRSQ